MTKKLFGTSGIRRKVEDLPKEFVTRLAKSLGTYSSDRRIAIGEDTRKSSPILESWFIEGLTSTGHDIVRLGIVPTPTLGMAAQDYGTGVMVTASHNPPEYNGFKFWYAKGAYREEQESEVEKIFYSENFKKVNGNFSVEEKDYIEKHINRIMDNVGILERPVRVLLDCANGSGSVLTPRLLEKMGCDLITINTEANGEFPHGLEPTAENLRDTCELVRKFNVDIGIVHDGDADRTAAIDKNGTLVDWDNFLAVLAYGKKKVVTTVDASMRIEDVCNEVIRTRIGDVAVANTIVRERGDFGGEPSGSIIFPNVHLFPDGPLTAAWVVKLVSENRFYYILNSIRSYPIERVKIPCPEELKENVMSNLRNEISGNVTYVDGIRLETEDGWILIRPSGTEPVIRITAEARNKKVLDELVRSGREWVRKAKGS